PAPLAERRPGRDPAPAPDRIPDSVPENVPGHDRGPRRIGARDVARNARDSGPDPRTGLAAARDEAARALDALDAARRRMARSRRDAAAAAPAPVGSPAEDRQLIEATRALAQAARELTRLLRTRARERRADAPRRAPGSPRGRRPDDGEPLITLDLTRRVGAGWRLCQYSSADRDAHRWHLRHDGHAAGAVTHFLNLRGERAGWEAHDARGFRLRPGPGGEAFGRSSPQLWATRALAVRAAVRAHRCP
ncbi:hypothetical protein, partial [Actinomadura rubrisoli]|uniref:hypothetical protein n=1 Tax=Actinomadura rubrisoli TaxID=2530368 RepID=UPI001A9E25F1